MKPLPLLPAAVAALVRTVTAADEARTASLVDRAVPEASAAVGTRTATFVDGVVAERVPFLTALSAVTRTARLY